MICRQFHFQSASFLEGKLTSDQNEGLREHLDSCGECVEYFMRVAPHQIDGAPETILDSRFTQSVVSHFPENPEQARMLRYFFGALLAASTFAVGIFAFIRAHFLVDKIPVVTPPDLFAGGAEPASAWLTHLLSIPMVQNGIFTVLAFILSIALICFVDFPKRAKIKA